MRSQLLVVTYTVGSLKILGSSNGVLMDNGSTKTLVLWSTWYDVYH